MIMNYDMFKGFMPTSKEVANSDKVTEVLLCIDVDKKEDVDAIVETAEKEGGKKDPTKLPEMPGMYCRTVEDLDGHVLEFIYMEAEAGKDQCDGADQTS